MPSVCSPSCSGKYSDTLFQTKSFMASSSTLESTVSMDRGFCAIKARASRSASMKAA